MGLPSVSSLRSVDMVRYVCLAKVMVNRKRMVKVGRVRTASGYQQKAVVVPANVTCPGSRNYQEPVLRNWLTDDKFCFTIKLYRCDAKIVTSLFAHTRLLYAEFSYIYGLQNFNSEKMQLKLGLFKLPSLDGNSHPGQKQNP